MSEKFTPGPWSNVPQSNGSAMICREYETGNQMNPKGLRLVANVLARGSSLPEDEANANLIAGAPELFVVANHPALEWILTDGLSFIPEPQRSSLTVFLIPLRDAALAKARGESS